MKRIIPPTGLVRRAHHSPETAREADHLTITPKLGILVGVTLFGLCIAGVLAGYLMQREMLNARDEQIKAIVEIGRNIAAGLQCCASRSTNS